MSRNGKVGHIIVRLVNVFVVLGVAGGETGVDVLGNRNLLLETTLLQAGLVGGFQGTVFIEGTTDKVSTVREIRSSRANLDALSLRRATSIESLNRGRKPAGVVIRHGVKGDVRNAAFHRGPSFSWLRSRMGGRLRNSKRWSPELII
jgi:hypothetical protein